MRATAFVGTLRLFCAAGFFLLAFFGVDFVFAGLRRVAAACAAPAACARDGTNETAHAKNKQSQSHHSTSGRLGNSEHVAQARIPLFRDVHIMQTDPQRDGRAVPPRPPQPERAGRVVAAAPEHQLSRAQAAAFLDEAADALAGAGQRLRRRTTAAATSAIAARASASRASGTDDATHFRRRSYIQSGAGQRLRSRSSAAKIDSQTSFGFAIASERIRSHD